MKYLFLLLILPLIFFSLSADFVYAQSAAPIPSQIFCLGSCPTVVPSQVTTTAPTDTTEPTNPSPSPSTSPSPSSSTSQSPSPSTNPCNSDSSVSAQSNGNVFALSRRTKKRKSTGNGLIQQFFGFMLQLFQLLLQQIGGQTPGTGTTSPTPTPTQSPVSGTTPTTNPCASPSPSSAVSTAPSSTPSSEVSPSTSPSNTVSTAPSAAPTTTPPTTTPPTLIQQLLQFLLQLLQYLFQQLGISLPCSSGTCTVPTPSIEPSTAPSNQPSSGSPSSSSPSSGSPSSGSPSSGSPSSVSSPSPSIIATPTVFGTSPSPSSGVSPSGSQTSPTSANATPTPGTATAGKQGLLESGIAAGTSTTNKLCLDNDEQKVANDNKVMTYACNSSDPAQVWIPYSDNTIRYKGNTKYCLDVNKNGTANDTLVDLYTCNGGANQKWTLTKITSGTNNGKTELLGKQSNKCLDIKQSSTANDTQLEIYTCNNGSNQVWSWNYGTLPPASGTTTTQWAYLAPANLHVVSHTTNQLVVAWDKVTGSKPAITGGVPAPTSYTVAVYRAGTLIRENSPDALTYTENGLTKGGTLVVHVWANGGPLAPPNSSVTVVLTQ